MVLYKEIIIIKENFKLLISKLAFWHTPRL